MVSDLDIPAEKVGQGVAVSLVRAVVGTTGGRSGGGGDGVVALFGVHRNC